MAYTGWFPCFSPSGDHVITGTGELWFDGTQQIGSGYTARQGTNSCWSSEHQVLFLAPNTPGTDTDYRMWTSTVGGSTQNLGLNGGYYEFVVGQGGRWAGWAPGTIWTSWGEVLSPGFGRPALTATRFAYTLDYFADTQRLVLDGTTIDSGAGIMNVQMTSQAIAWSRLSGALGRDVWGMRLDIADAPHTIAASNDVEFICSPIDSPAGPWALSYDQARLILRPFGETFGYVVATGETMYPSGVWHTASSTFRIAWSSSTGVYSEAYVDPDDARVDLGGTPSTGTPGETQPGNPGSAEALARNTNYPPLRHPILEPATGLVTKPWAMWFEAQTTLSTNFYNYIGDGTLLGRDTTGPGPATTITPGTGLTLNNGTLAVNVQAFIQSGTRANQPNASAVPIGTLYGVSDESVIERSNGTTWDAFGTT